MKLILDEKRKLKFEAYPRTSILRARESDNFRTKTIVQIESTFWWYYSVQSAALHISGI